MEEKLGLMVGVLIWLVSGLLCGAAWIAFAGIGWGAVSLAVGTCLFLEGAKFFTWRSGGWKRLVAVGASIISLAGIASSLWDAVSSSEASRKKNIMRVLHSSAQYQAMLADQRALETQRQAILTRLEETPADWATVFERLNGEEQRVTEELTQAEQKLNAEETSWMGGEDLAGQSIFSLASHAIGIPLSTVEFVLLMTLALLLEVSAYVLTNGRIDLPAIKESLKRTVVESPNRVPSKPSSEPNRKPTSQRTQTDQASPTADAYLKAALGHPRAPFLMGRQLVAGKLGISEATARGFLEELLARGAIAREGKFFLYQDR